MCAEGPSKCPSEAFIGSQMWTSDVLLFIPVVRFDSLKSHNKNNNISNNVLGGFYRFSGRAALLLSTGDFLTPPPFFFFFSSRICSALGEKHFIVLAGAPCGSRSSNSKCITQHCWRRRERGWGANDVTTPPNPPFYCSGAPLLFFAWVFFLFFFPSFQTLLIRWELNFPLDLRPPQPSVRKAT